MSADQRAAFEKAAAEDRAALVGYLPAGFPVGRRRDRGRRGHGARPGADVIEIGLPYSDPLMDGPVIQEAVHRALTGGIRVADVLRTVRGGGRHRRAGAGHDLLEPGRPLRRGRVRPRPGRGRRQRPDHAGPDAGGGRAVAGGRGRPRPGPGVPGRAEFVRRADRADHRGLRRIRLRGLADGHTGARDAVGGQAAGLVRRVRDCTSLPVAVGLGVRDRGQAARWPASPTASSSVPRSCRGLLDAAGPGRPGVVAVRDLAADLAAGVRIRAGHRRNSLTSGLRVPGHMLVIMQRWSVSSYA